MRVTPEEQLNIFKNNLKKYRQVKPIKLLEENDMGLFSTPEEKKDKDDNASTSFHRMEKKT